ncbi:hypothetical protein BF49_1859 [Bradyrhizobium sp.]|nr:hypothetical protein BF49_1859 [Bradyrhizobium sp.]
MRQLFVTNIQLKPVSAKGARSGSEREAEAEIAALSERISAV